MLGGLFLALLFPIFFGGKMQIFEFFFLDVGKKKKMSSIENNVKVIVRVRPLLRKEMDRSERRVLKVAGNGRIVLAKDDVSSALNEYTFDRCYGEQSTQQQIYESEVRDVLPSLFKGLNSTLFAYGVTSAGKTHTMTGTAQSRGIIGRAIEELLAMAALRQREAKTDRRVVSIKMSYLEIYNERVRDLLAPSDADLPVRETSSRAVSVIGLSEVALKSMAQFNVLYEQGVRNRSTGATALNKESSRSHAILIVRVRHRTSDERILSGKLNLIDLAGSEDNRRTMNRGERLVESGAINNSLMVLGKVVNALSERQQQQQQQQESTSSSSSSSSSQMRVPYRDSKLTRILQDSLGGSSFAMMIACCAPCHSLYVDTFQTLNFAARTRSIVNREQQVDEIDLAERRRRKQEERRRVKAIAAAARKRRMKQSKHALLGGAAASRRPSRSPKAATAMVIDNKENVPPPNGNKRRAHIDDDEYMPSDQSDDSGDESNAVAASTSQPPSQEAAELHQRLLSILNSSDARQLQQLQMIGKKRAELVLGLRPFESLPSALQKIGFASVNSQSTFMQRNSIFQ
jgi:DNA uptake protein ComE-like DNA-binding protein